MVERVLGTGAMGVVYLARDVRLGRLAALKTLSADDRSDDPDSDDAILRFRREAQLASALTHPNIVTLYEVGYEKNRFTYLAMEYVDGESLLSLMRRCGRVAVDVTCRVVDDVLQALAFAHERQIIHRDIKPGNVLIARNGVAKITDFGVARLMQASGTDITARGQLLGTPHYMSPEQIAGREVDFRTDLFSVGVMMFEMLAARKPFEGAALTDVLYNVVNQPTPELLLAAPGTPHWCINFVERLLAKTPEQRFESAAVAARELRKQMVQHGIDREGELAPVLSSDFAPSQDETPTTPITAPDLIAPSLARRVLALPVPQLAAVTTIGTLVAVTASGVFMLTRHLDDAPRAVFGPGQLEELQSKKQSLAQAELLYEVGAYDESRKRFTQYLEQYPQSVAASEGLRKSEAAISEREARRAASAGRAERVSSRARAARGDAPRAASAKRDDERPKRSAWSRVKSWFRR